MVQEKVSDPLLCLPATQTSVGDDTSEPYLSADCLSGNAPNGWTMYTHPRGSVYFRHNLFQVVIDENLHIPAILEKANLLCTEIAQLDASDKIDIHLSFGIEASVCLYVCHKQCVASYELGKIRYASLTTLPMDTLLRYRRLYWNFTMSHPCHRPCHPNGAREALDALRSYYQDHFVYGSRTIAPFAKDECEQLLELINRLQDHPAELELPSTVCFLGWILKDVYSYRTGQRYGQVTWTEMRAYKKAIHEPPDLTPRESLLFILFVRLIINGPCFGIPQTYLAHIKKASEFRGHINGLRQSWETYTHQLVREYSDFILISTVLLSATVGILTIDDIGQVAHVAALLSTFASLGSITIGVFFVWRHQRNTQMPSSFTYLHNARNSAFGLSGHAIILSLPPVLLVWSIVAFTVSAVAYALQKVTSSPVAAWIVVAAFIVVFMAVMAGVYTFSTIWTWQGPSFWSSFACWYPRKRTSR